MRATPGRTAARAQRAGVVVVVVGGVQCSGNRLRAGDAPQATGSSLDVSIGDRRPQGLEASSSSPGVHWGTERLCPFGPWPIAASCY